MKMKRIALVAMACLVSAGTLWAAGQNEKLTQGIPHIVIATADNTYGLSTDSDLQGAITSLIESKTNTKITTIIPPLASYTDKLATLVNSGDVPDVFVVAQAMTKIPSMVARGQLLDLTDYIKNSPALSKLDPSLFQNLQIDGKTYFIPYNYPKSKALYLRKDIMDQYGITLSNTPTTEEFSREMQKLAGTGIIPFCFPKWVDNFQFFYNSFGAWGGVYNENGQIIDGFQTQEMRDALSYVHQLYVDGVLSQEFITTENSAMREKTYTGKAASDIDYVTNYINYVQNTTAAGKYTEMHLIYKLVGPNGDGGALNEATQTAWVVSAKTENPEASIRVLETIVTDSEVYPAFFGIGVEGKHYTLDANGVITPTAKAANSGYKYTLNYLSDSFLDIDLNNLSFTLSDLLKQGLPKQIAHIRAVQPNLGPNHAADINVGVSVAYDRVAPSIKSTRESIATKIIVGSVSLEQGMQEYNNFWKSINGPEILKELNAAN
ncbi:ABC-type sugar transport system, periplasmic component [Sphaerochaeta pleomorpha str. Grapes]|uniref:ABC-type sugar transport system, periplasmic component n=1 Tax=Sphaerochaeta pleomorpha (strain ATCC BAA-1885 / DSM 22778 / Grapes) TaxID=158190 RepID=G8QWZ0_SPHPG|nr:extracellular solute-binding protein [Sphaerochaeta pleomorpha]AEV29494.1 ABC-type sugar transport system, periplasmic component [Sphaerochaeta pleomorpha str. Grapes]